ncbi:electron transfer flavoprotein subunit alpha/FixB family protein [Niallia sp. Krafla_26]|uniref:electron transfer flavoprotein subunit alpha/FixB family protein n=1 Tax=Niallia sp. Krafla_26 TaxID=3064703 RepID=UPI003D18555D
MRRTLVLVEVRDDQIRNVSFEALSAAQNIDSAEITAVILGSSEPQFVSSLAEFGADKVYMIPDERLKQYTPDGYLQALFQLVEQVKPDVILMGHTAVGKDVSPRLATKLGVGLISDVTHIELEENEIIFTRPIYAGKAFQKKKIVSGTIFATIRPNNIPLVEADSSRNAESITFNPTITDIRTVVKDIVQKSVGGVDLTEAKVIVSGGRGVKNEEGFKLLDELAKVLGGAVGASRGACDAGYCDYSMQVGQTGKVVTPDLYIACGISGAIQHLAGMSNSKVIVAINKDPEAPIFSVADYGIVGDLFEVVPLLTEEFKKLTVATGV